MKKSNNNFLIYLIASKEIPQEYLVKAGITRQLVYQSEKQGTETSLPILRKIYASLPEELQSKFLSVLSKYLKLKPKSKEKISNATKALKSSRAKIHV